MLKRKTTLCKLITFECMNYKLKITWISNKLPSGTIKSSRFKWPWPNFQQFKSDKRNTIVINQNV
jgi:hypothetical protein